MTPTIRIASTADVYADPYPQFIGFSGNPGGVEEHYHGRGETEQVIGGSPWMISIPNRRKNPAHAASEIITIDTLGMIPQTQSTEPRSVKAVKPKAF